MPTNCPIFRDDPKGEKAKEWNKEQHKESLQIILNQGFRTSRERYSHSHLKRRIQRIVADFIEIYNSTSIY